MTDELKEHPTLTNNDFVPPELFGRDHWSTLAYIECKLTDDNGYSVRFDARMRQNRRHFRILPGGGLHGIPMPVGEGSRLADGTFLRGHDDWNCIQDMLHLGWFEGTDEDWDAGMKLKLTPIGVAATAALRNHKMSGGTFSNAGPAVLAMVEFTKAQAA